MRLRSSSKVTIFSLALLPDSLAWLFFNWEKKAVNTTFVTTRTSNLKEDRLHVGARLDLLEQVGGHVRVDIPQVQLRQAGH